jgi:hypothetical protein
VNCWKMRLLYNSGMSDRELGRFIKDKWPELLVVVVILGLGKVVWDFNREIGSYGAHIENTKEGVGRIDETLSKVDDKLGTLSGLDKSVGILSEKVDTITRDVADLRSSHGNREVAKMVYETSQGGYARIINQCGKLSLATQVEGKPNVFRWPMQAKLEMWDVRQVAAGFEQPIPGASITAKLVDDGKACEMEVSSANPESFSRLIQIGITACVSITVAQSLDDETPYKPTPTRSIPDTPRTPVNAPATPND